MRSGVMIMRFCIFCGNPAETKEDAWPSWLMKKFPTKVNGIMEGQIEEGNLLHYKKIRPQLKVKFVCKKCNNGWMSQLEDKVKLILEPIFNKKPILISTEEQSILSTWALKTTMVLETIHHTRRFYLPSERAYLMNKHQPPENTYIWIAACVYFNGCYSSASLLRGEIKETSKPISGYSSTIAFGPFVVQVMTMRLLENSNFKFNIIDSIQSDPLNPATIQIWPTQITSQKWPSLLGLNGEEGLEAFRKRWIHNKDT
jgi:hypothetical protein